MDRYQGGTRIQAGNLAHCYTMFWPRQQQRWNLDVLIAGCDTIQAAIFALQDSTATVIGIDVSESSFEHAQRLIDKYQLNNLSLHRLPIEDVACLGHQFDLIECTGVLHHMEDQHASLRTLRSVLHRDGVMHLMGYAKYGRTGVYMFQEYCRMLGVTPTADGLSELQQILSGCAADHPIAAFANRTKDLTHHTGLADALLHPNDRAYTVGEVYQWFADCDMSFMRWLLQVPYLPRCSKLGHLPRYERLRRLPIEQQHAALDLFRGTMHMHCLVACRNDRPVEEHRIEFESDEWRNDVPQRPVGTQIKKVDMPRGIVAELRHKAHPYAEIALPLDERFKRVCLEIDGQRSIGQIMVDLDIPNRVIDHESLVHDLFEALWEFDQVIFQIP